MLIIVQTKMFSSRTEKVENKEYFSNNSPWTHRTEKKTKTKNCGASPKNLLVLKSAKIKTCDLG